jgi:hypothetical protein
MGSSTRFCQFGSVFYFRIQKKAGINLIPADTYLVRYLSTMVWEIPEKE